jgi:hypothetical protein
MDEIGRELTLDDLPSPPLFKLVDPEGRDVFQETEVGGEGARVCALFSDRELAGEFSAGAAQHGMEKLSGLDPRALSDWGSIEVFPLYMISDERGEAPLITVEVEDGEVLVATLFSSREHASDFRERAAHLDLPDSLGTIDDRDGLRRHALVAREAGATYAVIDPASGLTEAIPVEELIEP